MPTATLASSPALPELRATRSYPRTVKAGGKSYKLREMKAGDRDAMVAFARALPEEDLLFLRVDITEPSAVDEWIQSIAEGRRFTVLAEYEGQLAGYGSLNRQNLMWTRHLGEIRIIVGPDHRRGGLGALLAQEVFSVGREANLSKIVAQMARTQQGAQSVFRKLGFQMESMLTDWVIDRNGRTHDLVIMSHDVTGLTD